MVMQEDYQKKLISIEDFARMIKSGDNICTAMAAGGVSTDFHNAILARSEELENVTWSDHVQARPSKMYDVETMARVKGRINTETVYTLNPARKLNQSKLVDYLPAIGSDCTETLSKRTDIFTVMVTPPDKQGYVNLGLTNFFSYDLIMSGRQKGRIKMVVGEVNDQMPILCGQNYIHISEFDYFVENSTPLPMFGRATPSEIDKTIGKYVLELINDGDTIQMGLGTIPEAVIAGLDAKKDLGVHSEMLPMGLGDLVSKGIITNNKKNVHKGVSVASFCLGNQELYDYARENHAVELYPISYVNHPVTIAQIPSMVAINMGLLIDLTGQIVSEGFGHRQISGPGGQPDFAIGAYWSRDGKGITLLTSARKLADGSMASSILSELPPGSPVTVTRNFANYVITEYGIANLRGKTRRERAKALIAIAHPDFRAELTHQAQKHFYA